MPPAGRAGRQRALEIFSGRLREECLNAHWFLSLADDRDETEAWRVYYNDSRPHAALGERTPCEFAASAGASRVRCDRSERRNPALRPVEFSGHRQIRDLTIVGTDGAFGEQVIRRIGADQA